MLVMIDVHRKQANTFTRPAQNTYSIQSLHTIMKKTGKNVLDAHIVLVSAKYRTKHLYNQTYKMSNQSLLILATLAEVLDDGGSEGSAMRRNAERAGFCSV